MSALLAALLLLQASSSAAEPSVEAMVAQWRAAMLRRQQAYHSARVKLKGSMEVPRGALDKDPDVPAAISRPVPSTPLSLPLVGELAIVPAKRWIRKKEERDTFYLSEARVQFRFFDHLYDGEEYWAAEYGRFGRYGNAGTEVLFTLTEQPILWGLGILLVDGPAPHLGANFTLLPTPMRTLRKLDGHLELTFAGAIVGSTVVVACDPSNDYLPSSLVRMSNGRVSSVCKAQLGAIAGTTFPLSWCVTLHHPAVPMGADLRTITSLELNVPFQRTYFQPISPYSKIVYDSTGEELVIHRPTSKRLFVVAFLVPVLAFLFGTALYFLLRYRAARGTTQAA